MVILAILHKTGASWPCLIYSPPAATSEGFLYVTEVVQMIAVRFCKVAQNISNER
nr:MAG TPA: hypothetical protein [Caudoviricetes sp.]DAW40184.1 MAG TPA: hypothetical protein [Caudoviricetes sp.]